MIDSQVINLLALSSTSFEQNQALPEDSGIYFVLLPLRKSCI